MHTFGFDNNAKLSGIAGYEEDARDIYWLSGRTRVENNVEKCEAIYMEYFLEDGGLKSVDIHKDMAIFVQIIIIRKCAA